MIKLYISEGYAPGSKKLIGEFETYQEVAIAKENWLTENGMQRAPYSRSWQASDGDIYEDFGSWHYFFVTKENA